MADYSFVTRMKIHIANNLTNTNMVNNILAVKKEMQTKEISNFLFS